MPTQLRLRPSVFAARDLLAEGRNRIRKQHLAGSPGIQLGACVTDLLDQVVLLVFQDAIEQSPDIRDRVALVAHGSYGRRDTAPFSDVDLMLLYHRLPESKIALTAQRLVQDLSDTGLDLGFSVRTPRQAFSLAFADPVIFTSLVESRYLAGNETLFHRYFERFRSKAKMPTMRLIRSIEEARGEEQTRFGATVYLLEPNVKRSPGGLRDLQLLRWMGFAHYGEADPVRLRRMGLLRADDQAALRDAYDYLLRLRNDLHFHANAPQDVLTRPEQLRLAEAHGYLGDRGVLPVERFMQDYFHHTSELRNIVNHFTAAAKWGSPMAMSIHNFLGRKFDRDYVVGPRYVSARPAGFERVRGNLVEVLRLMELSNRFNKHIEHNLWEVIRESMIQSDIETISPEAAQRFMQLMAQTSRLGDLLRRLHEVRVLEKLVPGFEHVRCLLQFNDYHKYTVDEHSFRAVDHATEFLHDDGLLGRVYRKIKDKSLLHLALLIHDAGKGYAEDHSEVGKRIAKRVASHLYLSPEDAGRLEFLVHRHLMLNHLAFRRDNSDQSILLEAASEIGSPANLRMLFALSCADLAAVGPGVLNQWKIEVLGELYQRIMDTLSGGAAMADFEQRSAPDRDRLITLASQSKDTNWLLRQIESLPPAYVTGGSADVVLGDLQRLRVLPASKSQAWGRYNPSTGISEYSVGGLEDESIGIFHRLTGALASHGLQILSAEIHSLADGLFLDRFWVQDPDYSGEPPTSRFDAVSESLVASLAGATYTPPAFRQLWQTQRSSNATLAHMPTQIRVDNTTSERFTILDIFTHDRPGLLYGISRALFEQRLSVGVAKIGTYLDQVVDVFYVTDAEGQKVIDELRLAEIRSTLYHAIESWE